MARPNEVVAQLPQEYAAPISITGGEAFRVRVYEKAARSVVGCPTDVSTPDTSGLRQIPNVGASIAEERAMTLMRAAPPVCPPWTP